jgi:hypothetical protein
MQCKKVGCNHPGNGESDFCQYHEIEIKTAISSGYPLQIKEDSPGVIWETTYVITHRSLYAGCTFETFTTTKKRRYLEFKCRLIDNGHYFYEQEIKTPKNVEDFLPF